MLKKSNGGNAMKDVSTMGNEPQMPTKDEEIANLRVEVERLTRVAQAFTEHLHADMKTDLERRLSIPPGPRPVCPKCGADLGPGCVLTIKCPSCEALFPVNSLSDFAQFFSVAAPSAPAPPEGKVANYDSPETIVEHIAGIVADDGSISPYARELAIDYVRTRLEYAAAPSAKPELLARYNRAYGILGEALNLNPEFYGMAEMAQVAANRLAGKYDHLAPPSSLGMERQPDSVDWWRAVAQGLAAEIAQWKQWGVVEIAVRNPQVADYCKHWEERAEKAEAEIESLRRSGAVFDAAVQLLDAMETCHVCKGQLVLQEHPVHCEDCSVDCENHEGPECTPIYVLHAKLRKALAGPSPATAPAQPEKSCTYGDLPGSIRNMVEPHVWDNKNISEQRDYALDMVDFLERELGNFRRNAAGAFPETTLAGAHNGQGWVRDQRQKEVSDWCAAAFGADHARSVPQRGIRMLEEAIEAYQSATMGLPAEEMRLKAHALVDYVMNRLAGNLAQECGGVGLTLLALCQSAGISAEAEELREVARVKSKPLEHFHKRNQVKNEAGFALPAPPDGQGAKEENQ